MRVRPGTYGIRRYAGYCWISVLKVRWRMLNKIRCLTGSQWRDINVHVTWSHFLAPTMSLAAALWMYCRDFHNICGRPIVYVWSMKSHKHGWHILSVQLVRKWQILLIRYRWHHADLHMQVTCISSFILRALRLFTAFDFLGVITYFAIVFEVFCQDASAFAVPIIIKFFIFIQLKPICSHAVTDLI